MEITQKYDQDTDSIIETITHKGRGWSSQYWPNSDASIDAQARWRLEVAEKIGCTEEDVHRAMLRTS